VIGAEALAQRRQRILDAAERLGPGALTTRSLVAEAGISTGALYHHFASLDAVRAALAERAVVARAAHAPAGEDPLRWLVRALVCAPIGGAGAGSERVVRTTVDEVLLVARTTGALRPDVDGEALAELLELVWVAVDERHAAGALRTAPERLADALVAVLDVGVRTRSSG
jgi:AcrR family transcriptional regulator